MNLPTRIFNRPTGLTLIVLYKAVWGFAEIAIGVALVFSQRLIAGELAEDPTDALVHWLLTHFQINYAGVTFTGMVVIVSGLIKLILATGIWFGSWRFRSIAMAFFAVAAAFGTYRLATAFTWTWLVSVLADLLIVAYLWIILPKHLHAFHAQR